VSDVVRRLGKWEDRTVAHLVLPTSCRWQRAASLGAHLGDGVLWAVVGAVLLIWGSPFVRNLALFTALAVLGSGAACTAVKYVVRRMRPQELTQYYAAKHDRYAFPSGHATRMGAIAVVVGHFVPELAPFAYALAIIVAACRVAVGVHYPSDVIAGLLIGVLGASLLLLLL
jgi:undecaprenyl-diphosphatase